MSHTPPKPNSRIILWIGVAAAVAIVTIIIAVVMPRPAGGGDYTITDNKVTIQAASIGTLGTILVTDKGYALYTFPPDAQREVTCYDRCALNWPAVTLPEGVRVVAGPDVNGSLLGDVTDRNGKRVATYNGWPLYVYQGDINPGTTTGHGQYLDGGYWYVIRSNGEVVVPTPEQ